MLIFKVGCYLIAYVEPAVGSSIRIEYTCDQLPNIFVPVGYQGANLAKVAELLQAGGAQQTGGKSLLPFSKRADPPGARPAHRAR